MGSQCCGSLTVLVERDGVDPPGETGVNVPTSESLESNCTVARAIDAELDGSGGVGSLVDVVFDRDALRVGRAWPRSSGWPAP